MIEPVKIPPEVLALVERFDRNRASYESPQYNETQVRQELINPFFKALGWDIDNTQGYAEPYKDVVHEYSMKIEGASKAPDYSFPNRRYSQVLRRGKEAGRER